MTNATIPTKEASNISMCTTGVRGSQATASASPAVIPPMYSSGRSR